MSLLRRIEITDLCTSFLLEDNFDLTLDLLNPIIPSPFDLSHFETVANLLQIQRSPFSASTRRVRQLQSLSDRVSALELTLDRLANPDRHVAARERKYTWEAEVKNLQRSYKVKTEVKGGSKKSYKWTAEIKDGDDVARSYTFKSENSEPEKKKNEKKKKGEEAAAAAKPRLVEIEEEPEPDHRALVFKQAFAKRERSRGKRKELSPQDAAMMIQMTFKAHLIRRSQALRALRELAVAKAKLKELRLLFNNFAYRRRVSRDAEERQRFSEKIIVVLLTVDSIEGADVMVRAAKRSMTDELEAMLDVVDPQPAGKSRFIQRRTFDMPEGSMQKELAAGVAEVVQMLDQENGTFEACL